MPDFDEPGRSLDVGKVGKALAWGIVLEPWAAACMRARSWAFQSAIDDWDGSRRWRGGLGSPRGWARGEDGA